MSSLLKLNYVSKENRIKDSNYHGDLNFTYLKGFLTMGSTHYKIIVESIPLINTKQKRQNDGMGMHIFQETCAGSKIQHIIKNKSHYNMIYHTKKFLMGELYVNFELWEYGDFYMEIGSERFVHDSINLNAIPVKEI